ncbi:PAC2 family protein [Gordonia sp. X0973]|uniref:PAC2 family protein n=1 Tax=Gordonia sp. X0973 TaxID=2742602 RepID=UPI000F54955B|nr:PAC2 family protein [Gordonia sp. X0973]QKT07446.1 PAC2 family protein [Gordonia sp. X0973]
MTADPRVLLSRLRDPVLVAAFEGWNDAGEAASGAIEHLELFWNAEQVYEIVPDDYYDFQVNRPTMRLVDGVSRRTDWPTTTFSTCSPPGADHDLLLVRGVEPNFRWRRFVDEIGELADAAGTVSAVMLGSMMTDTPHTRPVPISGSAYSEEAARRYRLEHTQYQGPTGITAVLQDSLVGRGIPSVSLWAAVPHYISSSPNPKATLALLRRLEEVLDLEIPMDQLPVRVSAWERTVDEMTADDEDMAEYIRQLEANDDAVSTDPDALPEIDGERLAADFERYLRRRDPGAGAT